MCEHRFFFFSRFCKYNCKTLGHAFTNYTIFVLHTFFILYNTHTTHMIKHLIFDWGGVLSTSQHQEAVNRFAALGLPNAESYFIEGQNWKGIFGQIEEGSISVEDFLKEASALCGKPITFEQVAYAWWGFFHHVVNGVLPQLEAWKEEGYHLHMLTNNNPFMMSYIRSNDFAPMGKPFHSYFEKLYVSCDIGLAKPGKEIYQYVLADLGAKGEECIFADDRAQNLTGAAAAGMQTFWVKDSDNWLGDFLQRLGEI